MTRRWTLAALALPLLIAVAPARAERWLPVRETSLIVRPGSPLDFSSILTNDPITAESTLRPGPGGRLVRANAPDLPVRLLCASLAWSPASGGFPDHAGADLYAAQLRVHGYDIARLTFIDASLMTGRQRDFDYDPDTLDRFRYLLAALKRNGIYWILDGLTSGRGAYGGFDDRWDNAGDLKLAVQVDDAAFAHWLRFQREVLGTLNPYTGMAPLRDPALALVVPFNENGLEFQSIVQDGRGPAYSTRLRPAFNRWLTSRYATTQALREAWGGAFGTRGTLEDGTVELPARRGEHGARMRDFELFLIELETATSKRMDQALRGLGYRGLVASYNNWPSLQASLSRADEPAIAMNTYHDWIGSYEPGGTLQGTSSLSDAAAYMRGIAATRWLGRPFVVTEYDHLFWNPFRYEAALVMPAYGALQGWDVLCRHGHGPIVLGYGEDRPHKRQMLPYAIALDPVARAGETVAALVFRRGDVAVAPFAIPFVTGEAGLTDGIDDREQDGLTMLATLTAIGLDRAASDDAPAVPIDRSAASFDSVIEELGRKHLVATDDITASKGGRFDSVTDEITMRPGERRLEVRTRLTAAMAFDALEDSVRLGDIVVGQADGRGLIAVSSLDGQPIPASHRLLVVFATDARNTDMRFADRSEHVIADYGHLPVQIRAGSVALHVPGTGAWRLSPVGLDGTVHDELASGVGAMDVRLTNATSSGPTTFFLVERQ